MSHCTKFDFKYTNEEAIVKAFSKLNIRCSTQVVAQYSNHLSKYILSRIGHLGYKQYRAIYGSVGKYTPFFCKISESEYSLFIERPKIHDEEEINKLSDAFRRAYIEVAIDEIVNKLERSNVPSKIEMNETSYTIRFGSLYDYSIVISFENGVITEEVIGVKGDFCTKLTEDIERILAHPQAELVTQWKPEYNMQIEDQNIQILSMDF